MHFVLCKDYINFSCRNLYLKVKIDGYYIVCKNYNLSEIC